MATSAELASAEGGLLHNSNACEIIDLCGDDSGGPDAREHPHSGIVADCVESDASKDDVAEQKAAAAGKCML